MKEDLSRGGNGHRVQDWLLPYLHMAAFPLHVAIMTDQKFPFPAIGTVHLENKIVQHPAWLVWQILNLEFPSTGRPHAIATTESSKSARGLPW